MPRRGGEEVLLPLKDVKGEGVLAAEVGGSAGDKSSARQRH